MLLTVHHVTRYSYPEPVRSMVQSLRLQPSVFEGQRVLDWQLQVSHGSRGACFRDGAGDQIESWSVSGPVTEVEITVKGQIETHDTSGILRGHREIVVPAVYLRPSPATEASGALTALALGVQAATPLSLAHELSAAVAEAIVYRPGATQAHTTAAEALALGEGVCQDHAHALIACARVRGLAARYVSGYLHTDAEGVTHEASHAWAEVYLAGLGWVGFDPANNCCPDDRYIRLGSGFDAQDAAPIRGVARGLSPAAGHERMEVVVAVQSAEQ